MDWATLLPNSPSLSGPITRAVEYDQSTQTFELLNDLSQIDPSVDWQSVTTNNPQFQYWPNNHAGNIVYGGTTRGPAGTCPLSGPNATPPTYRNEPPADRTLCDRSGNLANAVLDTPGSIGYVDMGTARAKGFQYGTKGNNGDFWVPVQNNGTGTKGATFADPNVSSNGYHSGQPTGGADCAGSRYTPPDPPQGSSDPTLSSWFGVVGAIPSVAGYSLCQLTYALAWDDPGDAYGDTTAVDQRQRTVKDYLTYITSGTGSGGNPNDGQNILRRLDYDALTPELLTIAQNAVASLHDNL